MNAEEPPQAIDTLTVRRQRLPLRQLGLVIVPYLLLILIWSSTPLAVVWSVRELHPIWALAMRFVLAMPIALLVLKLMSLRLRTDRAALRSYVAGSMGLWGAMLMCYLGAVHLSSGLVSMLFGLSPLVSGLVAWLGPDRIKLQPEQWVGMLLGVGGMGIAVGVGQTSAHAVSVLGVVLILLAVLCYVLSMFWVRYEAAALHPMVQTTGSLIVSAAVLLLMLPFFWSAMPMTMPSAVALGALAFTVVMGSIVAMICYFDLVTRVGPTPVALTTIMTPVIAVSLGAWLNHEQVGAHMWMGLWLVLSGLALYFFRDAIPRRS